MRKPKARVGLLTQEHDKSGRRYVTVVDQANARVTLLETWEHGVLVLCDGERTSEEIVDQLEGQFGKRTANREAVERVIRFLSDRELVGDGEVIVAMAMDEAETVSREEPTRKSDDHVDPRARDVFELLRKAGLKVRSDDSDPEHRTRRRDPDAAERFDEALSSLTAGDLELSLAYFRSIQDRMRSSKRIRAFIETIEMVRNDHLPVTQETDIELGMTVLDPSR